MPRCTINLDLLRRGDYKLYIDVAKVAGTDEGVVKVDVNDEMFSRIVKWANQPIQPQPTPEVTPTPASREPQIDVDGDFKRDLDVAGAKQRLAEYAEKGLEDSEYNSSLIKNFIETSAANGYWSLETVDAAIAALNSKLDWSTKVLALNPRLERLGTLPSGEPQLPIDASEFVMRRASTKQLLDLNARRRATSNQQVIGVNKSKNRLATRF